MTDSTPKTPQNDSAISNDSVASNDSVVTFVYMFRDAARDVLYVDLTPDISYAILGQHFGANPILPTDCYELTESVIFSRCLSKEEALAKKSFLIQMLTPPFNNPADGESVSSVPFGILDWQPFPRGFKEGGLGRILH